VQVLLAVGGGDPGPPHHDFLDDAVQNYMEWHPPHLTGGRHTLDALSCMSRPLAAMLHFPDSVFQNQNSNEHFPYGLKSSCEHRRLPKLRLPNVHISWC
jgi:hypothetical protein